MHHAARLQEEEGLAFAKFFEVLRQSDVRFSAVAVQNQNIALFLVEDRDIRYALRQRREQSLSCCILDHCGWANYISVNPILIHVHAHPPLAHQYMLRPSRLSAADLLFGLVEADLHDFRDRLLQVMLDLLHAVRHDGLGDGISDALHLAVTATKPLRKCAWSHV